MGHANDSDDIAIAHIQSIMHIANGLREATVTFHASHPSSHSPFTASGSPAMLSSIDLPIPQPLLPSLLELGATHEIAIEASRIYQVHAEGLRRHIRESIVTIWDEVAEPPEVASVSLSGRLMEKVVSTAAKVYLRRLEQWKETVIQCVKQRTATPNKVVPKNHRTFKNEHVPLLEHFFEENPFPTQTEKVSLAEKSNMEYKQIHVWFQNRRNRTRKEGKALRKKPAHQGAVKPWDQPNERIPDRAVLSEETTENISKDAFASSSPAHAFPTSYPPICHYDPFPCKSGSVCFGNPDWRRVPYGNHPLSPSTSIDDLVEMFSRLSVRDGARAKGSPKLQSQVATTAITVIPPRAPHPSLIIRKYSQPVNIVQLRPSVRAHVTCPKAFESPSPTSKPVTLVPPLVPHQKNQLPGKRKTAPLPRRSGRMQDARRDTTPHESSSTSSSSPRLLSTDCDAHNCSFSSISSLSTLSDTANIQELSRLFGPSCRSPFDSPIHLRGLGEMVTISLSTVP